MLLLYQNNETPLYAASQEGQHGVVQTLLGAGANVNTARFDVRNVTFNYFMNVGHYKNSSEEWREGKQTCMWYECVCAECLCHVSVCSVWVLCAYI